MVPSRSQTVFCELTASPGYPEVAGACSTGHDARRYELDAVLSALQKNLRSDSSRDFLRGHSRFTGIIRAIDSTAANLVKTALRIFTTDHTDKHGSEGFMRGQSSPGPL